jgi:hypothetical protein
MSKIRSYMSLGELLRIAPTQTVGGSGSGQSGVTYLLRDDFSSDKAAGSVNGTPAEPGPGTRVVIDTNNKLSIAGGVLSFATGGVGAGDPGLWFGSLPMVLGRTVLGVLNDTLDGLEIGLDSNQSGVPLNTIRFNNDGVTLQIRQNGTGVAVGSFSLSTPYRCSIVLRNSAGSFYFIKGGLFSNWTLIWASSLGAGLNFPVATVVVATSVGTVDNLRFPTRLFIPFPLASDSFNRVNGALGLTDGAGHAEANGGQGLAWTDNVGTWAVLSNAAAASALSGGQAIATVPTNSADAIIDVSATRSAGNVGGIARFQDSSNYLRFYHDGTNAVCQQVVGGTPTTLRTAAAAYSAGAVLRLMVSGTEGRLFYNNAAVGAVFTVPTSTFKDHGLYTTNTGNSLDNFTVWARGTANEYSGLDTL